jgi:hypothetical protein
MKTDDFVTLLATAAQPVQSGATARRHGLALAWGGAGAMLMMMVLLGIRADIAEAVFQPMFWVKLGFPVSLAAAAFVAVTRLARPGGRLGRLPVAFVLPVLVLWVL